MATTDGLVGKRTESARCVILVHDAGRCPALVRRKGAMLPE